MVVVEVVGSRFWIYFEGKTNIICWQVWDIREKGVKDDA